MSQETAVETKELGFADKFRAAVALVASLKTIVVKTAADHAGADALLDQARQYRKDLKKDYDENPIVIKAKEIQSIKTGLDGDLEKFVKDLKNGPMLDFEKAEEAKRVAEENRLAKIRQDAINKENARLAAIAAAEKAAADKEAARLAAIAAKTKDKAKKEAAEKAAAEAAEVAALAEENRLRQIEDTKNAAPVVVVLEKTAPTTTRSKIKKWRIRTKDGRVFTKEDFSKKTIRLNPEELLALGPAYFVLNPQAISATVDGLGKAANLPGVEVWEENV